MVKAIEIRHMSMEQFNESMALSQFAFQYEKSAAELEQRESSLRPSRQYGMPLMSIISSPRRPRCWSCKPILEERLLLWAV